MLSGIISTKLLLRGVGLWRFNDVGDGDVGGDEKGVESVVVGGGGLWMSDVGWGGGGY